MPITRQFFYLPGSLAKGEEVQIEFDAIIAFINDLETDKLDAVGGTVSNLTVSGILTVQGNSVFQSDMTLESTGDLIIGDGSAIEIGNPTVNMKINVSGIEMSGSGTGLVFSGLAGSINFSTGGGSVNFNGGTNINKESISFSGKTLELKAKTSDNWDKIVADAVKGGSSTTQVNGVQFGNINSFDGVGTDSNQWGLSLTKDQNNFASFIKDGNNSQRLRIRLKGYVTGSNYCESIMDNDGLFRLTKEASIIFEVKHGSTLNSILLGSNSVSAPNLPTIAGASGTLWVDTGAGNVVKRVP